MKSILLIIAFVCLAVGAQAQSFIGGGLAFGSTVGDGFNGQDKSIGGFGEGTLSVKPEKLAGIRFDFNGLATLEHGPKQGTTSAFDLRLRPELRAFAPIPGPVKPFAGGGVQYSYFDSDQYNKSGLNYIGTAGVEIAGTHTARFSRLFTDRTNLNANRLEGFRYGYVLLQRFNGSSLAIRFSAEYNRFKYVQPVGPLTGRGFDGQSLAFRIGVVKASK
jgi:hypothetical protein